MFRKPVIHKFLNAQFVNPLQTVENHLNLESELGSRFGCSSAGFLQIYHHAPRKTNNFSVMMIHVNRSTYVVNWITSTLQWWLCPQWFQCPEFVKWHDALYKYQNSSRSNPICYPVRKTKLSVPVGPKLCCRRKVRWEHKGDYCCNQISALIPKISGIYLTWNTWCKHWINTV
jgi:hypothetical protein